MREGDETKRPATRAILNPMHSAVDRDNWDRHWADFQRAAEFSPGGRWRQRLLSELLAIEGSGESARVLEIGSGPGFFAEKFTAEHPRAAYLGLDVSAGGVQAAAARVPSAQFLQRDLLRPPCEADDLSFHATHAICSEVLEHVDDPELLLRNSQPYMSDGCRLVVTVPGGPMGTFHRHIGHRRHFTAESLRELLTRAGLTVEWASGVGFPFFDLYSLLVVSRGDQAIRQFSGAPSLPLRAAGSLFSLLFRMNSMRAGWQIAAVCRSQGNGVTFSANHGSMLVSCPTNRFI